MAPFLQLSSTFHLLPCLPSGLFPKAFPDLPLTPRSSKWLLSFRFPHQNSASTLPYAPTAHIVQPVSKSVKLWCLIKGVLGVGACSYIPWRLAWNTICHCERQRYAEPRNTCGCDACPRTGLSFTFHTCTEHKNGLFVHPHELKDVGKWRHEWKGTVIPNMSVF